MKRSPLKRSTKPMRKRSRNRFTVEAKDRKWREAVRAKSGGRCAFPVPHNCQGGSIECHHIFGRQAFPHLRHEVLNGIAVCVVAHRMSHDHPRTCRDIILEAMSVDDQNQLEELARSKR
jgi:predicted restriction endonuclease